MAKKKSGKGWFVMNEKELRGKNKNEPATVNEQEVAVRMEKRAGGKKVTVAHGFTLDEGELKKIAKALKKSAGAGGTVKPGVIEIQGECIETVKKQLEKLGVRVKG